MDEAIATDPVSIKVAPKTIETTKKTYKNRIVKRKRKLG